MVPEGDLEIQHAKLRDWWGFLRERKKFWLLPIVIIMVIYGGLIVLMEGSAIAPFFYTPGADL